MNIKIIADIHFGAKDDKKLYDALIKYFIPTLDEETDLLVIAGDTYHRILKGSELGMFYVIQLFNLIVEKSKINNFDVVVLQGTKSHDNNQLNLFKHYCDRTDINFTILEKIREMKINGVDMLFIPEEYVDDQDTYYNTYFNKHYDLIFFHGNMDFVSYSGKITLERNVKNAPNFKSKQIMECCELAIGGHVHTGDSYKNKIFYTGSFDRFCFGEPECKGFLEVEYNKDTKEYIVRKILNEDAEDYITVEFDQLEGTLEEKIKELEDLKKTCKNIRIECNDNSTEMVESLKNLSGSNIKIKMNNKKKKDKNFKFSWILERKYSLEETIKKYIKETKNIDVNIENIKESIKEIEE